MMRITPLALAVFIAGCLPPSNPLDAGGGDGGGDSGSVDSGVDSGTDSGVDSGTYSGVDSGVDSGEPELSCVIPEGGDVEDVELVQAWNAFVADDTHFTCVQDDDCVHVGFQDEGDFCGCISTVLVPKHGIALRADAAAEAGAFLAIASSEACAALRETGYWGYCDGNPPLGPVCSEGRCKLEYDECGWCGMNGCDDAGPDAGL